MEQKTNQGKNFCLAPFLWNKKQTRGKIFAWHHFYFSITYDYKKRKVTSEDKKMFHKSFSTDRHFKQYYPRIKNHMQFPDYFPAIEEFKASDNKLYVWTHKKKQGKTEFFVFDMKGKLLKKVYLPFFKRNFLTYFPMTFQNNTLYQLIYNPDTETWELHRTPVF